MEASNERSRPGAFWSASASGLVVLVAGSFHPTVHDTTLVVAGVLITVGAVEPLRRYRGRQQQRSTDR
jgi:hypothetical protein